MNGPLRASAAGALAALLASCAAAPTRSRATGTAIAAGPSIATGSSTATGSFTTTGPSTATGQSPAAGDYSQPTSGRLTFTFGQRRLGRDFAPTDEPQAFGVEFSRISAGGSPSFGLGFELGFQFADDRARGARLSGGGTGNLDLFQSEFYAGLRAQAGEGSLRPYLGAGATWITNDTRVTSGGLQARESSSDLGAYGHAGLLLEVSRSVHVLIDGRMTFFTDHSIDGTDFDSDYSQVTIGVGASY